MTNKKDWEVALIPVDKGGEYSFRYQLYRIKDENQPDYTGNREWGKVFKTQEEAEKEAEKLNKKYPTFIETQMNDITPKEFWEHCNKLLEEYHSSMEGILGVEYERWLNPHKDEDEYDFDNEYRLVKPYYIKEVAQNLSNAGDEKKYILRFDFDDDQKGYGYFYATDFSIHTTALIMNGNYSDAYKPYKDVENEPLDFLTDVVKIRGIELEGGDLKNIKDAVIAVSEIENNLSERELFSKLIKTDEFNDAYKSFYIKNKDFVSACERNPSFKYPEVYADVDNGMNGVELHSLEFMKEVVKAHGTDTQTINDAVNAITEYKQESPRFMAKLLQCTLQTNEYRQAFDAVQGKSQENTR